MVYSLALLLIVAIDQLSKYLIWHSVGPAGDRVKIEIIAWLQIIFVRNTGSAFGLFQGQSSILAVLSFGALIFLGILFYRNARHDLFAALALGLIAGGAIGNLIDRLRLGYVIDWIDVPYWPTFNAADSAITIGMICLVYTLLFRTTFEPEHDSNEGDREPPVDVNSAAATGSDD